MNGCIAAVVRGHPTVAPIGERNIIDCARRCTGAEAACIAGATVWRPAQAEIEATIAALTANSIRVEEVVIVCNPAPV